MLSVEYILNKAVPAPPAFLLVLDTSLSPEELQAGLLAAASSGNQSYSLSAYLRVMMTLLPSH